MSRSWSIVGAVAFLCVLVLPMEAQSPACSGNCSRFDAICKKRESGCESRLAAYKAYMAQMRVGVTLSPLPAETIAILAPFYTNANLDDVRTGAAIQQMSVAITDCNTIYFFDRDYAQRVADGTLRPGVDDHTVLYHELRHVEQCADVGGRDAYAVMWWRDLDAAIMADKNPAKLHDNQPMEADANARENAVNNALPDGIVRPVSMTGLVADVASPTPVHNTITWTSTATGGVGALEFDFAVRNGVTPLASQTFGPATFAFTPVDEGTYTITARARQASPARTPNPMTQTFVVDGAGGRGGADFVSLCQPGSVLIGLQLRTGVYVDSVAARCADIDSNGRWVVHRSVFHRDRVIARSGSRAGGTGGAASEPRCDRDYAVAALTGRSGTFIDSIGVECHGLLVSGGRITADPFPAPVKVTEHGGTGGARYRLPCPAGQVATGVRGKAGTLVEQIDIVCGNPTP